MAELLKIFISSTTKDLGSYREVVTRALLDRQVHPVVKEHFATTHRELNEYLTHHLSQCDAVVSLVGFQFGHSPDGPEVSDRRSWTQLEYDYAVEHDIPVLVFLADQSCPFDHPLQEPEDEQLLQERFRAEVTRGGRKYDVFRSREQLRELLLRIDIDAIQNSRTQRLRRRQRRFWLRCAVGVFMALLCGAGALVPMLQRAQPREDVHNAQLTVGHAAMRIPVELVYSAKVGDRLAPIPIQSVVSSSSTYQLPEDLQGARESYAQEQAAKAAAQEPHSWDGPIFRMKAWDLTPGPDGERMTLVLQVESGKYFDFVITHLSLHKIQVRTADGRELSAWDKYIAPHHAEFNGQPNPNLSNMFGVSLTAVTADGHVILHRRSKRNAVVPDFMHVSVAETTKAPTDAEQERGLLVYNAAVRGLSEELCISNFDRDKVEFLALIYSRELAQFDLVGMVQLPFTRDEMKQKIAGCRDNEYENERMKFIPFNPASIAAFMQQEPNWSPFAVASLLAALQYEFGSAAVDREFARSFGPHPVELRDFQLVPQ